MRKVNEGLMSIEKKEKREAEKITALMSELAERGIIKSPIQEERNKINKKLAKIYDLLKESGHNKEAFELDSIMHESIREIEINSYRMGMLHQETYEGWIE